MNVNDELVDFAKLVKELREAEEDFITAFDRGHAVAYELDAQRRVQRIQHKVDQRVKAILQRRAKDREMK